MKQAKRDQLRAWFEQLEQSKQVEIALECIEELVLAETISFYENTKVPYWSNSGDQLDGFEKENEDED